MSLKIGEVVGQEKKSKSLQVGRFLIFHAKLRFLPWFFLFLRKKIHFFEFFFNVPSLARSVPKPLKVPSLARSLPKPLKVPSVARSVPEPLKVPSLARSVQKPLKMPSPARSVPKPRVGEAGGPQTCHCHRCRPPTSWL